MRHIPQGAGYVPVEPLESTQDGHKHIQAIGRAISDLFNDGTIDAATAAKVVAWAWHTAAIADCCERGRHDTITDADHMIWPHAATGDGRYAYACPDHSQREWSCYWNPGLLNALPKGWQL